ncbi:MAG: hypothetical protein AVDCRST_MAG56-84 [uncultured Cytophagales bacterium]|uniref:Uncharacterized protein n=1 Tax=uncultured Cytophagales bacterium TaxID=158755 RepID=A0A6J4H3K1_9SPHI|nr:MAG: hypothetical protein AVDCRST_MAG56-84 [uncultured Cytophagales bacterium]
MNGEWEGEPFPGKGRTIRPGGIFNSAAFPSGVGLTNVFAAAACSPYPAGCPPAGIKPK